MKINLDNLPKLMKLKKSGTIWLESGLATNNHWILDVSWLLGLESKKDLGLSALQNKIKSEQIDLVKERLSGAEIHQKGIEQKFSEIKNISNYKEFSRNDIHYLKGFKDKKSFEKETVYLRFKNVKPTYFDIEYSSFMFFDLTTKIFICTKDDCAPMILRDVNNKVVLALAPLNPKHIGRIKS